MSRRGLLFVPDQDHGAGTVAEVTIFWPAPDDNSPPIELSVVGDVVRCDRDGVAIRISRHEFWHRADGRELHLAATGQT